MRARSRAATRAAGDYASAAAGADRAAGTALAGPAGAASRGGGNARTPPAGMALACRGGGARRYRSRNVEDHRLARRGKRGRRRSVGEPRARADGDRKSTRLNSSHSQISYAVFCLKKKTYTTTLNV